jgi:hypothetical protein
MDQAVFIPLNLVLLLGWKNWRVILILMSYELFSTHHTQVIVIAHLDSTKFIQLTYHYKRWRHSWAVKIFVLIGRN